MIDGMMSCCLVLNLYLSAVPRGTKRVNFTSEIIIDHQKFCQSIYPHYLDQSGSFENHNS